MERRAAPGLGESQVTAEPGKLLNAIPSCGTNAYALLANTCASLQQLLLSRSAAAAAISPHHLQYVCWGGQVLQQLLGQSGHGPKLRVVRNLHHSQVAVLRPAWAAPAAPPRLQRSVGAGQECTSTASRVVQVMQAGRCAGFGKQHTPWLCPRRSTLGTS